MSEKGSQKVSYKYYLLGETVPIRITFNERGDHLGAEVPSPDKGRLVHDATYIGRVLNSFEVDEISEQEFLKHAENMLGHKLER